MEPVIIIIIILIIIGAIIFKIAAMYNKPDKEKDEERDEAEMELHNLPYPLTDPVGMPAPPQGYLTSNIPISTVTLPQIPSTMTPTCPVLEEDATSPSTLPPSYSAVMLHT